MYMQIIFKNKLYWTFFFFFRFSTNSGPDKWGEGFPIANGPRQSPIDIIPGQAPHDPALKPLKLKYDPATSQSILNNGHSFQVDFVDDADKSSRWRRFYVD